jgi:hypothetical protein
MPIKGEVITKMQIDSEKLNISWKISDIVQNKVS